MRQEIKIACPWSLDPTTRLARYVLAVLTVLAIGAPLYALGSRISDDNEVLLYLGGGILGALYMGRGPARLASIVCLLVMHAANVNPGFRVSGQGIQYLISSAFFLVVTDQIARFADQARREAWSANRRERAEELLRLFGERGSELGTAEAIESLRESFHAELEPGDPLSNFLGRRLNEQSDYLKQRLARSEQSKQEELLRAKQELQSTLLRSISHDLQTPLSAIAGTIETLERSREKLTLEQNGELLRLASDQATRLDKLIKNLLSLTRLEAGALQLTDSWVSLEELFATVRGRFPRQSAERIRVSLPALPEIQGDFNLLGQVFANLLDNALKYSDGQVVVHAEVQEDSVSIRVLDEGVGVRSDDRPHIFERFYRGKTPLNVPGSGLGLNICKALVDLHRGQIEYQVREPGSCFQVTLPIPAERALSLAS
ncbi:DUF4118 domain-containing protein [bacterium]|nr:DUF4118 domain-containing protein [bacterium]